MNLKRPNKQLEDFIIKSVLTYSCPIHQKTAKVKMPSEKEPVEVEACCAFFKNDILTIAERIRKEYIYKDEKTRERLKKEQNKHFKNKNE